MKTIKKQISVLLAVMIILCSFTVASFSASAAETTGGKITVKSNLCDSKTYSYTADDTQLEVTYYLQCDNKVVNMQGGIYFDSSVLKIADSNTLETSIPVFSSGSAFVNFDLTDKALFNATNLHLYDFTSKGVFFTIKFDIIGSGDTDVSLDVDVITATTANDYSGLSSASDIDLVYYGNIMADKFTFASEANVIPNETKNVSVFGDVNLELTKEADRNVYTGTTDLQAGTYTFRINELGTTMCYGGTFTDTMNSILYSSAWKSATTFKATGGRYTFSYNADTDKLTVKFKSFSEIAELFGDINVELVKSKTGLFSGIARLDAGTYTFRINDQGTTKCCGGKFNDSIYQIEYNSAWKSATTFVVTGGTYSIQYDPSTSKLKVLRSVGGLGDVRIFGDIELDLVKEKGTIYSASTNLKAGKYAFRVDDFGTTMCNGGSYTDSIYNVQYSSAWKSETTLTATGGKYTFTYDSSTDKLKVLYTPAAKTVSIFGDINLTLTKGTSNVYTGSTKLKSGTYSFRIDELGTTMCNGGTYTDTINTQYSSDWKAATKLNATGGTYTFKYNADTNKLTVTYKA